MTSINTGRGFPLVFGDNQKVLFNDNTILTTMEGSIGYEAATDKFYGVTVATDVESTRKRTLTQTVASRTETGQIKIGTNLEMNSITGVMSSIAVSGSRIFDLVITISTISGAADYTDIATAIQDVIGTPGGGYTDGTMTQASQLNSAPSETYQFIILLSPGIYEISNTIVLPDYVSIIGTNKNECIIKYTQSNNTSIINSAAITTGTNSVLADFTLELDPNNKTNICGIYNDSNNIIIDNVNIRDIVTSESSTTIYGIYGTGEMIQTIKNIDLLFSKASSNAYGLYFNGTINRLNNCKIEINSEEISTANTANYGIYMTSCYLTNSIYTGKIIKYNDFYENNIIVKGANLNYGIYCMNSSVNSLYNNIDCGRLVSGRDGNNYGIGIKSSSSPITTSSTVIKFNHVSNGKDTIQSTDTGTVNFSTLGFVPGHIIKVSGADKTHNNNFFTIASVTSSLLTLTASDTLIHEPSPSGTIIISLVLDLKIFYNQIYGTKHSIYSDGSNGNFCIYEKFCCLEGGDINLDGDKLKAGSGIESGTNTITVSKRGGDFTTLSNAIANIVSNSDLNKYLINIEPGEYIESGTQFGMINLPSNISIIGSGMTNTILKFNNSNGTLLNSGCIKFTHNNTIMNMTIENNNNEDDYSYIIGAIGTSGSKISNVSIINVQLKYNGNGTSGTKYGLLMSDIDNMDIHNIKVNLDGLAYNNGIDMYDSTGIINKADVIVQGNSNDNTGISLINSNINIFNANVLVTATASSTPNYGIKLNNNSESVSRIVNLNDSMIRSEHNGLLSGTNEFSIYRDGTGDIGNGLITNTSRLDGDIRDAHTSSNIKMRFNNCYSISSNNVYKSIGNKGHLDEASNGNIIIGANAGGDLGISSSVQNTIIGVNTGNAITSGSYNTFIGSNVGNRVSTNNEIVAFGYNSGNILGNTCVAIANLIHPRAEYTGQDHNILIGKQAGYSIGAENSENVIIGNLAGANLTVATNGQTDMKNLIIGSNCAYSIDDGVNNVMIGDSILYNGASGSNPSSSVLFGNNINYNSSNSANNVFLGHNVAYNNTGTENVMIGRDSGYNTTSANRNTLIGNKSGFNSSQGDQNIYFGVEAGYGTNSSTSSFNIGFGNRAGYNTDTSGDKNIMFGGKTTDGNSGIQDSAGYAITSGSNNMIFGISAGKSVTTGIDNILLGGESGKSITTGIDNIMIGSNAGSTLTITNRNVFIGSNAGSINESNDNIYIGDESGRLNISTRNIAFGYRSGYLVNAADNIFFGHQAGGNINGSKITGSGNNFMGFKSGYNVTSGENNLLMGGDAGLLLTSGSNNVCFGYSSGSGLTIQNENICLGAKSGQNTTGNRSLMIGPHAGKNVEGDDNIMVGYKAGTEQTIGVENIYIGFEASKNLKDGRFNIVMGYKAGYNNTLRADTIDEKNRLNICIGKETGYNLNSNSNILMGRRAGYNLNGIDNGYNIFVGKLTGNDTTSGNKNIYMGDQVGRYNVAGDKNICLGSGSGLGDSIFSTNKNILIGVNSGRENKGSKHIYIGNSLDENNNTKGVGYASTSRSIKNIYIGNNCGIENTSGLLNIGIGSESLFSITTGERNISIGDQAMNSLTTGRKNIAFGDNASYSLRTGLNNIMLGSLSGSDCGSSINNNILLGRESGRNSSANNLIALGTEAGKNNTSALNNIYIGTQAGLNCNSSDNILFGFKSGKNITSGSGKNIFIGSNTGTNASTTCNNSIAIGFSALKNGSGNQNICLGSNAGIALEGTFNICVGVDASRYHTSNSFNIIMGNDAVGRGLEASNSIVIGYKSGYNLNGRNCIAIGTNAQLENGLRYDSNYVYGVNSLRRLGKNDSINTDGVESLHGNDNLCIGTNTLREAKRTSSNIVFGVDSLRYYDNRVESTGGTNGNMISIGTEAAKYQHSSESIFLGYQAGMGKKYGEISFTSDKISIFRDVSNDYIYLSDKSGGNFVSAGFTSTSTNNCSQIMIYGFSNDENNIGYHYDRNASGDLVYREILSVTSNVITLGKKSPLEPNIITEAEGNTITIFKPSQYKNICVGYQAGRDSSYGYGQKIGYRANPRSASDTAGHFIDSTGTITEKSTGTYNTFIGANSGRDITNGTNNLTIGKNTLMYGDLNADNTIIGHHGGSVVDETYTTTFNQDVFLRNVGIGSYVLNNLAGPYDALNVENTGYILGSTTLAFDNIAIGHYAIAHPVDFDYSATKQNVCIGNWSGYGNMRSGNFSIGYQAALYKSGGFNTYIGMNTGIGNETGTFSVFLTSNGIANPETFVKVHDNEFAVFQETKIDTTYVGWGGNTLYPILWGNFSTSEVAINNRNGSVVTETNTRLYVNGAVEAYGYTPFTGIHIIKYDGLELIKEGMIVSSTGKVSIRDNINTTVTIYVSDIENDKKVFGIYAGVDEIGRHRVASVGEGMMLVINYGDTIENGDYICSSGKMGYGMKQEDDLLHSYTVAKATEDVIWDDIDDYIELDGVTYKWCMIGCTYHCG